MSIIIFPTTHCPGATAIRCGSHRLVLVFKDGFELGAILFGEGICNVMINPTSEPVMFVAGHFVLHALFVKTAPPEAYYESYVFAFCAACGSLLARFKTKPLGLSRFPVSSEHEYSALSTLSPMIPIRSSLMKNL